MDLGKEGELRMQYIVNEEISKRKGRIFAFFGNLRAAFDRVDRNKLREVLKKMGIETRLRRRISKTYKETKNIVKVENRTSEEFWTKNGVRQGCPMSLTLFNIHIYI